MKWTPAEYRLLITARLIFMEAVHNRPYYDTIAERIHLVAIRMGDYAINRINIVTGEEIRLTLS